MEPFIWRPQIRLCTNNASAPWTAPEQLMCPRGDSERIRAVPERACPPYLGVALGETEARSCRLETDELELDVVRVTEHEHERLSQDLSRSLAAVDSATATTEEAFARPKSGMFV